MKYSIFLHVHLPVMPIVSVVMLREKINILCTRMRSLLAPRIWRHLMTCMQSEHQDYKDHLMSAVLVLHPSSHMWWGSSAHENESVQSTRLPWLWSASTKASVLSGHCIHTVNGKQECEKWWACTVLDVIMGEWYACTGWNNGWVLCQHWM